MAKGLSTDEILLHLDLDVPEDDIEDLIGEESSGDESDLEDEMPPESVIPKRRIQQEETESRNFYKGPVTRSSTRPQYAAGQSNLVAGPSIRPQFPASRSNPVAGPSSRPQFPVGRSNPVAGPSAGPQNAAGRFNPVAGDSTMPQFPARRSNSVTGPSTRPQVPTGRSNPVPGHSSRPQFPAGRSNSVTGPSTRPQVPTGQSNPFAGRSNRPQFPAGQSNSVAGRSTAPQRTAGPTNPVTAPSAPSIPAQRGPGLGLVDPSMTRAVPAEIRAGRRRRKKKRKIVNNIQDTLDENNYDAYEIPRDKKEFSETWKPTNFPKRTDNWVNQKTVFSNDKEEHEIIKGEVGEVVGRARGATSPLLAWECFFDQKMLSIIVQRTNESIGRARDGMEPKYLNDPRVNYIHYTDEIEIRALIGLIYWRGLLGMQNHNIKHMFGEDGHHFFGGTMAKNRFAFLVEHLSFDDKLTRPDRWQTDRFAAIREIFEYFNANCSRSVAPGLYLSIDETLAATRLKTLFTVYNPAKPAKYGILYRSINSVEVPYTHSVIVMAGKPENTEGAHYYINSVIGSVERLIMNLKRYQQIDGRIITTDNLYTSVQMADVLLQHNISTVGTMRINSGGVPKEFKEAKTRAKNSYQVLFKKDKNYITLHSYVVQTKSKKEPKNIIMLSSKKTILGTSKEDHKKPAIIEFYNYTKGKIIIFT